MAWKRVESFEILADLLVASLSLTALYDNFRSCPSIFRNLAQLWGHT